MGLARLRSSEQEMNQKLMPMSTLTLMTRCSHLRHVTCAVTDNEILSKVTSIEEDEEDCQDTDEIEDLFQPLTKYEAMQALEVLQTCTFCDADVGDEMRARVNAFSKLYDISMTKAKRQKAITDFFVHNEHKL